MRDVYQYRYPCCGSLGFSFSMRTDQTLQSLVQLTHHANIMLKVSLMFLLALAAQGVIELIYCRTINYRAEDAINCQRILAVTYMVVIHVPMTCRIHLTV